MGLDNPVHIAFLLVVLLLVFGAKRLPEMGRSLGHGLREFKDSISGSHDDADRQIPPPGAAPEVASSPPSATETPATPAAATPTETPATPAAATPTETPATPAAATPTEAAAAPAAPARRSPSEHEPAQG